MRKCPFCAEPIQDEAIKCDRCGSIVAPVALEARIRQLLETGQKIEAIKFLRDNSELDLKGAKQYVERLAPRTGRSTTTTGGGRPVVIGLLVLIAVLFLRWWMASP